jgi:D-threonate/D-erythronate kinase
MIVIADDLTGAAEIAGICLRFGLQATISLNGKLPTQQGVSIICTDTRSMPREEAKRMTKKIMSEIGDRPVFYTKIDSVCRGHVLDELIIEMNTARRTRAIIVPANPSLGRTIVDGAYYINGVPINKTGFANDPEFPLQSALVKDMLGATGNEIAVITSVDEIPATGLVVAETATPEDIDSWVHKAEHDDMLVGAGDFFTALLQRDCREVETTRPQIEKPFLYISGTAFSASRDFIGAIKDRQGIVLYIKGNDVEENWLQQMHTVFAQHQKAILAIDPLVGTDVSAETLRTTMASYVKEILQRETIKEILIEGGATAAAIIRELGIEYLQTEAEWERGVVRMKEGDCHINFKPGSYQLPVEIKELFSH